MKVTDFIAFGGGLIGGILITIFGQSTSKPVEQPNIRHADIAPNSTPGPIQLVREAWKSDNSDLSNVEVDERLRHGAMFKRDQGGQLVVPCNNCGFDPVLKGKVNGKECTLRCQ